MTEGQRYRLLADENKSLKIAAGSLKIQRNDEVQRIASLSRLGGKTTLEMDEMRMRRSRAKVLLKMIKKVERRLREIQPILSGDELLPDVVKPFGETWTSEELGIVEA